MSDPVVGAVEGETVAERRARLLRMRILSDSENRLKRILGAQGTEKPPAIDGQDRPAEQCSSSPICDNVNNTLPEYPVFSPQLDQKYSPPEPDQTSSRESEVLPRKVSMISSPIDYKTLQRSQEHAASVNNYLNSFQLNIATPTIVLVIVLAIVSSFGEFNIPSVFCTFEAVKYSIALQFDVKKGSIVKDLTTFLFVYAMIQALLHMIG